MPKSWNEMTTDEKLDFLRISFEHLGNILNRQGAWIHDVHIRLEKVEKQSKDT